MDKNQINIDDLFRNRLSGAEEKERPGAWLAMRDLLETEMPVQAAINWRRLLGIITALVVATSVSVGGYKYYAHQHGTELAANSPATSLVATAKMQANAQPMSPNSDAEATINHAAKGIPAKEISATATVPAQRAMPSGRIRRTGATGQQATQHVATASANASRRQATTTGSKVANHPSGNTANTNDATGKPFVAGDGSAASHRVNERNTNKPQQTTPLAAANPLGDEHVVGNEPVDNNNGALILQPAPGGDKSLAASGTRGNKTPIPSRNNQHQNNQPAGFVASSSANRGNVARNTSIPSSPADRVYSSKPSNTGNSNPALKLLKDTIQQIEIVYRQSLSSGAERGQYRIDTVARQSYVIERLVPVVPTVAAVPAIASTASPAPAKRTKAPAENAPVVPAAKATTAASVDAANDVHLVSLSKFKVSSKFHNAWANNAERVNKFVKDVSITMARSQFYGGITGGFNSAIFTANTLAGFQLGVTGMLAFNERWSIAGELKFYQRFNNGKSVNDDYTKTSDFTPGNYSTQNGQQYQAWTWNETRMTHYYNFTTTQTIEAPVTLRRNIGRVFGEVGLNMMYAFAVNVEEIELQDGASKMLSRNILVGNTPEAVGGGRPQVTMPDFGARFGFGYVFGAGYQFTPALNVNAKLVQNFWDNASSDGGRKVSRSLYQTPSLQLSVGYRFSQNRNIKTVEHP